MPWGSPGFFSASSDSFVAHTNTPEVPADFSCIHSSTSSKFVYCFCERHTPLGLPVQWTEPSFFQSQVSLSQLTLTKSSPPSAAQPWPVPSMNAFFGPSGAPGLSPLSDGIAG